MNPTGRLDVDLNLKARLAERVPEVAIAGKLSLEDAAATMGLEFRDVAATVTLSDLHLRRGQWSGSGKIVFDRLAAKSQVVRDLSLDFVVKEPNATSPDRQIVFTAMSGVFHGGTILGDGIVHLAPDSGRYGLDLQLSDVDMASFIRSALDYGRDDFQGTLSGRVSLKGEGVSPENLVSTGELSLTAGQLWLQPLPLKVFELLNLSKPDSHMFTDATIRYELRRKDLFLQDLRFIGKGISVHGRGWIRQGKTLDLAFVSGSGADTFSPSIVEPLKQMLTNVRVKGNVNDFEARIDLVAPVSAPIADFLDMILGKE